MLEKIINKGKKVLAGISLITLSGTLYACPPVCWQLKRQADQTKTTLCDEHNDYVGDLYVKNDGSTELVYVWRENRSICAITVDEWRDINKDRTVQRSEVFYQGKPAFEYKENPFPFVCK